MRSREDAANYAKFARELLADIERRIEADNVDISAATGAFVFDGWELLRIRMDLLQLAGVADDYVAVTAAAPDAEELRALKAETETVFWQFESLRKKWDDVYQRMEATRPKDEVETPATAPT